MMAITIVRCDGQEPMYDIRRYDGKTPVAEALYTAPVKSSLRVPSTRLKFAPLWQIRRAGTLRDLQRGLVIRMRFLVCLHPVAERGLVHVQLGGHMRNRPGSSTTILAAFSLNSGETSSDFRSLDPAPFQMRILMDPVRKVRAPHRQWS